MTRFKVITLLVAAGLIAAIGMLSALASKQAQTKPVSASTTPGSEENSTMSLVDQLQISQL